LKQEPSERVLQDLLLYLRYANLFRVIQDGNQENSTVCRNKWLTNETYPVQFVIESASVANGFPIGNSSPKGSLVSATVRAVSSLSTACRLEKKKMFLIRHQHSATIFYINFTLNFCSLNIAYNNSTNSLRLNLF
jgi:hypothetical protein